MPKYLKWILIEVVAFAIVFTGVIALVALFVQPYMNAETNMPKDGGFEIRQLDSGELEISWPKADRAHYYLFQIYQLPNDGQFSYQNSAGTLAFEKEITKGTSVVLPADAFSGNMLFRVTSAVRYVFNGTEQIRFSEQQMEMITRFEPPVIESVSCETDSEKCTATIRLEVSGATTCHVSLKDASGKLQPLKTLHGTSVTLTFGVGGDLPMPAFGEKVDLHFTVSREAEGLAYSSTDFAELSIDRSMLVPADIFLDYQNEGAGSYRLTWEEEDCDYYEIQQYDAAAGSWSVFGIVGEDEGCTCVVTGTLSGQLMVFRVVAAYEKEAEGEDGQIHTTVHYRSVSNEIGILDTLSESPVPVQ